MGNKLCAPLLKKNYRGHETNPWHSRKDSHLLRLWADVFRVHGDGEFMRWERVSEDVVPVNISCIEDTPSTVFHITAYNRQVEKIFDVNICQPGTIICPATECFVHWRDASSQCEWGLNFSTPTDAQRFRDCCSFPTQRFARKASSASSLRLSPPKQRQRSRAASASSPSSPVRHSNPIGVEPSRDEGCQHTQGLTVISTSKHNPRQSNANSSPPLGNRNANGNSPNVGASKQNRGQSPPPSYAVIQRRKDHQSDDSTNASTSSASTSNPPLRKSLPAASATGTPTEPMTSSLKAMRGNSLPSKINTGSEGGALSATAKLNTLPTSTPSKSSSLKHSMDASVRPSSAVSDMANQKNSSPKHVVISDIVSVNITGTSAPSSPTVINPPVDKPNGILKRDTNSLRSTERISETGVSKADSIPKLVCNPSQSTDADDIDDDDDDLPPPPPSPPPPPPPDMPKPGKANLRVDTGITSPLSRNTSSSESPEWPSPPEPLTPQTPLTPNTSGQMSFDSDAIQRMLRSLPSSPLDKDMVQDPDLGFHEESVNSEENKMASRRGSRLSRTKSLNVHDRNSKGVPNPRQRSVDNPPTPSGQAKTEHKPRKFNRIALERELKKRNKNMAANYPDSGIGMAGDGALSLKSDPSLKSAFTRTGKSAFFSLHRAEREIVTVNGSVVVVV